MARQMEEIDDVACWRLQDETIIRRRRHVNESVELEALPSLSPACSIYGRRWVPSAMCAMSSQRILPTSLNLCTKES